MNDEYGAAPAAAETVAMSQPQDEVGDDRMPSAAAIDRTQETARHSLDRAFAVLDPEGPIDLEHDERPNSMPGGKQPIASMDPPQRFSADAKAAWNGVPDSVKGEVGRAFRELESGLTQYQQAFEPLRPYFQMASQSNTSVHEALERYTALDGALISKEPEARLRAIESVLDHAGITPREYATFILGQKPAEAPSEHDQIIRELRRQVATLHNHLGGVTRSLQQRQEDEALRQVETFAEANPRLNEPEVQMTVLRLLQTQMAADLQSAYDMAERLTPAPPRTALNPRPNPAQTRNGNLTVTGAPGSGSNPAKRKAPSTARESVDGAFASLGLG